MSSISRRGLLGLATTLLVPQRFFAQTTAQNRYIFASKEAAAVTLSQNPIIEQYSTDDLRWRLRQGPLVEEGATEDVDLRLEQLVEQRDEAISAVRNLVASNVREWSSEQKTLVEPIATDIMGYMTSLDIQLEQPIALALVGNREVGSALAYTVNHTVAFPNAALNPKYRQRPEYQTMLEHYLAHEISHVMLRYAANREEIYAGIGFHKADIILPDNLSEKILRNPDQPEVGWYLSVKGVPKLPLPMRSKEGKLSFAYVILDDAMKITGGTDTSYLFNNTPKDIITAAGNNASYVAGPAELAAELFALSYMRHKNPQLQINNPAQVDTFESLLRSR